MHTKAKKMIGRLIFRLPPFLYYIILISSGFLIGFVLALLGVLMPSEIRRRLEITIEREDTEKESRKDESISSRISRFAELSREKAEEGKEQFSDAPRSARVLMGVFYGFIAMSIVVLMYTPLRMNWFAVLGGLFGGFIVARLIFSVAKRGKLRLRDNEHPG